MISPQVIAAAGPDGSAQLSAQITFAAGEFRAHFPYDTLVRWTGGCAMVITNDAVNVPASGLAGVEPVQLPYHRDCLAMDCPASPLGTTASQFDTGCELKFTRDGGLAAQGNLVTPAPIQWGHIPSLNRYAHSTHAVQPGGFLMAGFFLSGAEPAAFDEDRPGTILLSGFSPADPAAAERPQDEAAYAEGLGDYSGLNFRVTQHPGLQGESTLGGQAFGPYTLTSRSKYYVRWGGVNGIHEAVPGSFAKQLLIYSYDASFSNFGLSFLSSENEESRTQGYVRASVDAHGLRGLALLPLLLPSPARARGAGMSACLANKARMVAIQLKEKATADASQQRTLADSEFYTAKKKSESEAYQITKVAEAEATRISLTSQAQKEALRQILQELEGKGTLAEQYIQVLIAQELRQNSKWIISNGQAMPIIDLSGSPIETESPPVP